MSITTEIQRIQQAKADIKTAINNKGGTLSDTATIDTFASAINNLPSGGGGSSSGSGSSNEVIINGFQYLSSTDIGKFFIDPETSTIVQSKVDESISNIRNVFSTIEQQGAQFYVYKGDFDMVSMALIETWEPCAVSDLNIFIVQGRIYDWLNTSSNETNSSYVTIGVKPIITPTLQAVFQQDASTLFMWNAINLQCRTPFIIKAPKNITQFFWEHIEPASAATPGYDAFSVLLNLFSGEPTIVNGINIITAPMCNIVFN